MIHALRFASVLIAGAGVCCACSGGGGGGGGGSPTMQAEPKPIVVSTTFPSGNAKPVGGGTAWDIVGVTTTLYGQFHYASGNAYDTLRVDVTFAQNVANALPAPGQAPSSPSQLGMTVQLDTGTNGFFEHVLKCPDPHHFNSDLTTATPGLVMVIIPSMMRAAQFTPGLLTQAPRLKQPYPET